MNENVRELKTNREFEEYKIVDELGSSSSSINIKIKCISKNEEKKVVSRSTGETMRVTEALVGDETGCVYLSLWNDDIDKIEIGHIYKLTNVYTKMFRGSLRLNIGKYGNIEAINSELIKVNTENNKSDEFYTPPQWYHPNERFGNTRFANDNDSNRRPFEWNRLNNHQKKE